MLVLVRVQVFVYWLICVVLFRVRYEYCIARCIGICFVYVMYMYLRIGWVWCTLCKFSSPNHVYVCAEGLVLGHYVFRQLSGVLGLWGSCGHLFTEG